MENEFIEKVHQVTLKRCQGWLRTDRHAHSLGDSQSLFKIYRHRQPRMRTIARGHGKIGIPTGEGHACRRGVSRPGDTLRTRE